MENSNSILKDKNILIAGGSSGMGFEIAKKVLEEGAIVHLVSSNIEKLEKAKIALGIENVYVHALDISDETSVIELASKIDKLDHLVTTAARLTFKPLAELSRNEISQMIDAKLWGPLLLTKYLAPKLASDGSIVYFSGVAADKGGAGASVVGAVNSALHGLAKNLVYELSPIRVNVVSPGIVQSPTWDFMDKADQDQLFESAAEGLPAKRIGQPTDLAETALYLIKNKYTNGTVITVDGGANA